MLIRGVVSIVLALAQNLFDDNNDDNNDDDTFVSLCRLRLHHPAASTLVQGLVVALARLLAQVFARGVIVIVLALAAEPTKTMVVVHQ